LHAEKDLCALQPHRTKIAERANPITKIEQVELGCRSKRTQPNLPCGKRRAERTPDRSGALQTGQKTRAKIEHGHRMGNAASSEKGKNHTKNKPLCLDKGRDLLRCGWIDAQKNQVETRSRMKKTSNGKNWNLRKTRRADLDTIARRKTTKYRTRLRKRFGIG
jgi:hypothetical protein